MLKKKQMFHMKMDLHSIEDKLLMHLLVHQLIMPVHPGIINFAA